MFKSRRFPRFVMILLTALIASGLTLTFSGPCTKGENRPITDEELEILDRWSRLEEIRQILTDEYYLDVDEDTLVLGAIDGMMASLDDPYTFFYTREEMEDQKENSTGNYKGVGMSVQMDGEGAINVVRVFRDSPADRAGVLAGDKLIAIDGDPLWIETAKDLDEAVTRIRGVEDTEVVLTFRRGTEEIDLTCMRGEVSINYVEYQLLGDYGYLMIYEFEETTAPGFFSAEEYFKKQGAKGLIIDLRGNPGGMLASVVKIADELLPEGKIIYTEDRAGNITSYYSSEGRWEIPIVVLINGSSASASEILSASLHDYGLATLVGTTSFGKGIVQLFMSFDDGTGMQYTESRYYTPAGKCIHGIGVEPDVVVELSEDYDASVRGVDLNNDNQLAEAVRVMDELTAE